MSAVVTLKKGVSFPVNANVTSIVVEGDPENYAVRDTVKGFDLIRKVNDRKIIAGMIELPDDSKETPLVFLAKDESLIAKGDVVSNKLFVRYVPQPFVLNASSLASDGTGYVYSSVVTVNGLHSNKQVKIRVVNGEADAGATAVSGVFEQEKTLTSHTDGTIQLMVRAVKVGIEFDDLYKCVVYVNDLMTEIKDTNPPVAQMSLSKSRIMPGRTKVVTIKFNEMVTGLDIDDFTVNNGSIANITGSGKDYTLELTAGNDSGLGSLTLENSAVADRASNLSTQSASLSSTGSIVVQLSGKAPVSADTSSSVYVRVGTGSGAWTISTKSEQDEMLVIWI